MKYYDYDELIQKLIPEYTKMHQLVVDLINIPDKEEITILDLGVGTGQTALCLFEKYPNLNLVGVDISPKMIQQAKVRLNKYHDKIRFIEQDISKLDIKGRFDGCVAVLSIHHLDEKQKPELFRKIFNLLDSDGVFVIGDIIKFDSEEETRQKEEEWKRFLIQNLGEEEGQYWFDNYKEEDLPSSVPSQLKWLREAGFKKVECVWKYVNYAVFYGIR